MEQRFFVSTDKQVLLAKLREHSAELEVEFGQKSEFCELAGHVQLLRNELQIAIGAS